MDFKEACKVGMLTLILKIFILIRFCIDKLIDFVFGRYYKSLAHGVPKPTNLLVLQCATSLAKQIRKQKLSSEEVVRAFIERIEQVNPLINAVVDFRFEVAIEEAKRVDQRIKNQEFTREEFDAKPFLGVPFTTKESNACKGMKHSFGLVCRKQRRAIEDADAIQLIKRAGGILIGVTNVPILNMWQETSNLVYGRTNNPYNCSRTAGGSCGGEAAIIAACGVPFGIGNDWGGSIRIPAFACGIFGHKPTCDLIPTRGVVYRTGKEPTIMAVGVLTRTTRDIIPLLKVLVDGNMNKLQLDRDVQVYDLQIYYMLDCGDLRMNTLSSEMNAAILRYSV
uniref:Amidase domain-containing protein n=1 Tax=Photinus pyralis TaxID=7054 RepID=A0A1Y1LJG2_PHOPY